MRTGQPREMEGPSRVFLLDSSRISVFSRGGDAADERPIQKIADADSERNDAERCNRPDVAIRLDAGNQSEGSDVADGSADQQDAGAAGRPRPRLFSLPPDIHRPGEHPRARLASPPA